MRDNLSIVITMIIFVILVVIFPLYNYFERQDDMSYNLALKATTNFVDEVLQSGYMDQEMYDKYIYQLGDTGNIYDIELEAHRKILIKDKDSDHYNEEYLIDYNKDIFDDKGIVSDLNEKVVKDDAYYFNEGDQFYVKMKNSNTTMAGAIFNTIVPTASKDRIVVNYGGVIKNQAWSKVDATYMQYEDQFWIKAVAKLGDETEEEGHIKKGEDQFSSGWFKKNEIITLTAEDIDDYTFKRWEDNEGSILGSSSELNYTVDSDKRIFAIYERNNYTLSVETSPNNIAEIKIDGDPKTEVNLNGVSKNKKFTIEAISKDNWYEFDHWKIRESDGKWHDLLQDKESNPLEYENPNKTVELLAVFKERTIKAEDIDHIEIRTTIEQGKGSKTITGNRDNILKVKITRVDRLITVEGEIYVIYKNKTEDKLSDIFDKLESPLKFGKITSTISANNCRIEYNNSLCGEALLSGSFKNSMKKTINELEVEDNYYPELYVYMNIMEYMSGNYYRNRINATISIEISNAYIGDNNKKINVKFK